MPVTATATAASPLLEASFLGRQGYDLVWQEMKNFTDTRNLESNDQLWLLEHPPVFTLGQAGKTEHVLNPGNIPLVRTDRGGQVTYHGPGQLMAYPLLNLRRISLGVRDLVTVIEQSVVDFLAEYNILAYPKASAPGVYVEERKIASLGLRVRRGCSFHGVAINIDMDLKPFYCINPCGYAGLEMARLSDLSSQPVNVESVAQRYAEILAGLLGLELSFPAAPPAWYSNENVEN